MAVKQIRLLTLSPGGSTDDVHVTIRVAELAADEPPRYEALSYVWGSEKDPLPINVEDKCTLRVSQNLEEALRHLRYRDRSRTLWVDAVCINQSDLTERSQQVLLMGDIYRMAHRVVVWLGPEADDSTYGLAFIEALGGQVEVDWVSETMKPGQGQVQDHWADTALGIPWIMMPRHYKAISELIRRPWFERVWIRQEIHLSNPRAVVQCGTKQTPWRNFRDAMFCINRKADDRADEDDIVWFRDRVNMVVSVCRPVPLTFRMTLHEARGSLCKDPRDRVYGLLNICSPYDREKLGIVPDYTLPTANIYRDLTCGFISAHGSLNILLSAGLKRNLPSVPSWIPDWTVRETLDPGGISNAGARLAPQIEYLGGSVLKTSAVLVSKIATIMRTPPGISRFETVRRQRPECQSAVNFYGGEEKFLEAYCRAICFDYFSEKLFPDSITSRFSACRRALDVVLQSTGEPEWTDDILEFNSAISLDGRAVCITDDGHIGVVFDSAQDGDAIVVLPGCDVPLAMRPSASKPSHYEIVGETYLHDIMDGEAVLGPLPEGYTTVWRRDDSGTKGSSREICFLETSKMEFVWEDPRLAGLGINRDGLGEGKGARDLSKRVTRNMLRERGTQLEDIYLY